MLRAPETLPPGVWGLLCDRPLDEGRKLGSQEAALGECPELADSGFTTVQVRCRLSARWLTLNRATKMRAEGLGLLASISISAS